jgi:hypothetical protein
MSVNAVSAKVTNGQYFFFQVNKFNETSSLLLWPSNYAPTKWSQGFIWSSGVSQGLTNIVNLVHYPLIKKKTARCIMLRRAHDPGNGPTNLGLALPS